MVLEFAAAAGVTVHPNGVALAVPRRQQSGSSGGAQAAHAKSAGKGLGQGLGKGVGEGAVTARLLIDSTGNFGPMVRQARWGARPDGVCLVVGACCRGFPKNTTGTLLFTPQMKTTSLWRSTKLYHDRNINGAARPDRGCFSHCCLLLRVPALHHRSALWCCPTVRHAFSAGVLLGGTA